MTSNPFFLDAVENWRTEMDENLLPESDGDEMRDDDGVAAELIQAEREKAKEWIGLFMLGEEGDPSEEEDETTRG